MGEDANKKLLPCKKKLWAGASTWCSYRAARLMHSRRLVHSPSNLPTNSFIDADGAAALHAWRLHGEYCTYSGYSRIISLNWRVYAYRQERFFQSRNWLSGRIQSLHLVWGITFPPTHRLRQFFAAQRTEARYMLRGFLLVRLSVCHTVDPRLNGSRYRNMLCTTTQ